MTVLRASTPSGYSIFCDDVRVEENGKQIYIGVYQAEMLIAAPSLPVRLPTLHVVTTYRERKGDSDKPVRICIFIPGLDEPLATAELRRDQIDSIPVPAPSPEVEDPVVSLQMVFGLRDVVIGKEGQIRARAFLGDDEVRLGGVRVKLVPEGTTSPTQAGLTVSPETKEAAS